MDDKKFSVQINMYFGVHWTETRLKLPKPSSEVFEGESSGKAETEEAIWLPIDLNFMNHLWVPNVFVYNLASFEALTCLEKLAGLWIIDNQNLFYNQVQSDNTTHLNRDEFTSNLSVPGIQGQHKNVLNL